MRLKIHHRTEYSFATPVPYALQRVRLVPVPGPTHSVSNWSLKVEGAKVEVEYRDQLGKETWFLSIGGD